jgi:hypothetical protein
MPTIYLDDRAIRRLMYITEKFATEHDADISLSGAVEYLFRKYARTFENLEAEEWDVRECQELGGSVTVSPLLNDKRVETSD